MLLMPASAHKVLSLINILNEEMPDLQTYLLVAPCILLLLSHHLRRHSSHVFYEASNTLIQGLNVSSKSMPYDYAYPFATNLALYLLTHLHYVLSYTPTYIQWLSFPLVEVPNPMFD